MMGKRNKTSLFLILIIAFLLSLLLFTGCKKREETSPTAGPKTVSAAQAKKRPLRVSITGFVVRKEAFDPYIDLFRYISKKSGRPVEVIQRKTYQEINELMKNEIVDVAFICSPPYIKAHQDFGAEILAVPVVNGESLYHSYIIVRKDSGINDFTQLKGKSFAFSDPLSNSGRLYATYLLATQGTTPEDYFSQYIFTYNHDDSLKAVVDRSVDGAALSSLVFDYHSRFLPARTMEVKIIWKSPRLPIPPFVVRKGLEPALKAQLKKIFLNIHKDEEGKKILKKLMFDKFSEGDDKMYNPIRQMMSVVGW